MNKIVVSICCITYNHSEFIRECLDGFLSQECDFAYEILVHDDASTDGTAEILKKYQEKFPERIFPIFQKENQFSKGIRNIQSKFNFSRARGNYIALCEGDDYWTNSTKLQKQINFLEQNQDFIGCFTNGLIQNEITGETSPYKIYKKNVFTINDFISKGAIFPTASLVFRNIVKKFPVFMSKVKSGDRALALVLSDLGKIHLVDEEMCIYRRHSGGVFSSILEDQEKRVEIDKSNIYLLREFNKFTKKKYDRKIKEAISNRSYASLTKRNLSKDMLQNKYFYRNLKWRDWLRLIKYKMLNLTKSKNAT